MNYHYNKKFQQANVTAIYAYVANESTLQLVDDGMSTGLTNTHTARGFSVLYHVFAWKQCILCSALHHKSSLTLPYVTSLWDSFCLGTFVHGFIRLPPCSLASSRDCSLAIHVLNIIINYNDWSQLTSKMIIYEWGIGDQGNWKSTYVKKFHPFNMSFII